MDTIIENIFVRICLTMVGLDYDPVLPDQSGSISLDMLHTCPIDDHETIGVEI